jgi:formylglycine-generating enzyme required for sulfatase activity
MSNRMILVSCVAFFLGLVFPKLALTDEPAVPQQVEPEVDGEPAQANAEPDQKPVQPIEVKTDEHGIDWVAIPGGTFQMGCAPNDSNCEDNEKPRHRVRISPFRMMKSEVTVGMYRKCVEAGRCTNPKTGEYYNWGVSGREDHPINGVDWNQANKFCEFAGGRLPSEAEWEYAARGSDGRIYPWGNQTASCRYAIMNDRESGCGKEATWPGCSKPAGNSPFGLCDMAGNVYEWVGDCWNRNYNNAPADGSIWSSGNCSRRVRRGGSWNGNSASGFRAGDRSWDSVGYRNNPLGLRCARTD